jgi:hypothetical protein
LEVSNALKKVEAAQQEVAQLEAELKEYKARATSLLKAKVRRGQQHATWEVLTVDCWLFIATWLLEEEDPTGPFVQAARDSH